MEPMFGKKPVDVKAAPAAAHARGNIVAGSISSQMAMPSIAAGLTGDIERITYLDAKLETSQYREAKRLLIAELLDQLDFQALEHFPAEQKRQRVLEACDKVLPAIPVPLTAQQLKLIKQHATQEILGFGPIEPLLEDPDVN